MYCYWPSAGGEMKRGEKGCVRERLTWLDGDRSKDIVSDMRTWINRPLRWQAYLAEQAAAMAVDERAEVVVDEKADGSRSGSDPFLDQVAAVGSEIAR